MLIELPILCSCWLICEKTAGLLRYVTGFWVARGLIYLLLSAGAYALYAVKHTQNVYLIIVLVAQSVSGVLFLIAAVRREKNPAYELLFGDKAKGGSGSKGAASSGKGAATSGADKGDSGSGGFFGGIFGGAKKAAVDAAGKAGAAAGERAARSAAEDMFGSTKPSSSEATDLENPPLPAVTAPTKEPSRAEKASLFTGGGLFGGSTSKYGFDNGTPEANPFVNH